MSGFKEYPQYDALGLAELVRRGEVTPAELLDAALAQTERWNPRLNAICSLVPGVARASLATLPEGPFSGVPFLLKDITASAVGLPMSNGSRFFAGTRSDHDSELVARYRRAGLVILGRTTTSEMAICPSVEAAAYGGPTRNPWSPAHSAGGSSGGSGAAVAAGVLPMAHGSDGGGSIRIPASCNGVFGFKPTRARMPLGPDAGDGWGGLLVEHVLTRSVRDSAAALDATHGADPGAPYVAPPLPGPMLHAIESPPDKLRIAFLKTHFDGRPVHPEVAASVETTARLCASLGHEVSEDAPHLDFIAMMQAAVRVMACATAAAVHSHARLLGREPNTDELEPSTWGAVRLAAEISGTDALLALASLNTYSRICGRFFERYDLLLTPVVSEPPPPLGRCVMSNPDFLDFRLGPQGMVHYVAFTPLANVTGQPAMSVPLARSKHGLPIGSHFLGRIGGEATLFKLAAQLEAAQPWSRLPPQPAD